jgi:hypothetical protein
LASSAQRPDQSFDVLVAVGVGDQRHDPAVVGQLDVDALVLAQPVRRREAGKAEPDDVDRDVGGVEGEGAGAADSIQPHDELPANDEGSQRTI